MQGDIVISVASAVHDARMHFNDALALHGPDHPHTLAAIEALDRARRLAHKLMA